MSLKSLGSWFVVFSTVLCAAGCSNQTSLPITIAVTPSASALGAGQSVQLSATVTNTTTGVTSPATTAGSNGVVWAATAGSVDASGNYTAPSGGSSTTAYVIATSKEDRTKYGYATIHVVASGQVSTTGNSQVALYTATPGSPANMSVQFGTSTNYGLTTWTQPSSTGGPLSLFVAGMVANTPYHMRAMVQFSDGTQFTDADHTFTPQGGSNGPVAPSIITTTTPGMTPQSGVELLNTVQGTAWPRIADLNGNILWSYSGVPNGTVPNPFKLLSNGHFLINFSVGTVDGQNSLLQEIDLTGKVIWQMSAAQLNQALSTATCAGCNITVVGTHHDFVSLPNGHVVVIAATQQVVSGTTVTGDVLIDLDENHNPVWLWNEFDHLDINRRPYMYPDWTHTNAILYSPDDGNLVISIRHQNWLVKINYQNGQGNGDIVWHLGYQGDFTLVGGTDPTDWFWAQHGPSFVTANTTGVFSMILFDNGDDRVFASGITCGATGAPPCLYSTVPMLQLDETAMTATIVSNPVTPNYSFFGGNAEVLANGNIEFCEAAGGPAGNTGTIYEMTPTNPQQQVWQMQIPGIETYRGFRLPSLYPGVQW
jgi:arylsulfate sulfotransferase